MTISEKAGLLGMYQQAKANYEKSRARINSAKGKTECLLYNDFARTDYIIMTTIKTVLVALKIDAE